MKFTFLHNLSRIYFGVFILFCLCITGGMYAQSINQNIITATQKDLQTWLDKIPEGNETPYGFTNRAEFKNAQVGTPIHVLTLSKDEQDNQTIVILNEYRVPVVVNNEYRTFVTVVFKDDQYHIVDLGGSLLAREIQTNMNTLIGNIYLLRIYPLHTDFLVESTDGIMATAKYYPLQSAVLSINQLKRTIESSYTQTDFFELINAIYLIKK